MKLVFDRIRWSRLNVLANSIVLGAAVYRHNALGIAFGVTGIFLAIVGLAGARRGVGSK